MNNDLEQGSQAGSQATLTASGLEKGFQSSAPKSPLGSYPTTEKARIVTGMEDILRKAGRSEEDIKRTTGRIGGKLPGSWSEVAGAAVPLAIGSLFKPARTATRALGTLGLNIFGRGAAEAGIEALQPTGKGILNAGLTGGAKGVLPGLVQAGVSTAFGAPRNTLKAQKALAALKSELTPELAAKINPNNASQLYSERALKKLKRVAGKRLDDMENRLGTALRGQDFALVDPKSRIPPTTAGGPSGYAKSRLASFEEVRDTIKTLRREARLDSRDLAKSAQASQKMDYARQIEESFLNELRAIKGKGTALAQDYLDITKKHAKDAEAVNRWMGGLQEKNALLGRVNPQDRPGLAQAQQAVAPHIPPSAGVHGAVGALEGAIGRPGAAAWQLGRVSDYLRSRGPTVVQGPLSPLRRIPGPVAGAAAAIGQDLLLDGAQ